MIDPAARGLAAKALSQSKPSLLGPTLATLGDSITANDVLSSPLQWSNTGYGRWLQFLTGQAFNYPMANNFGIAGQKTAAIAARIDTALAVNPDILIVMAGTNDLTSGNTADAATFQGIQANWRTMAAKCFAKGTLPVFLTIPPRALSGTSSNLVHMQQAINIWLREWGRGNMDAITAASMPAGRYPVVVDPTQYLIDNTTAGGDPLTTMVYDGVVHPNPYGCYWIAKAILAAIGSLLPARPTLGNVVLDVYDATLNPSGNLIASGGASQGIMKGTTGTNNSAATFTSLGNLATGWATLEQSAYASTVTVTNSKESPRTDGPNSGERQKQVYASSGGGVSGERYQLFYTASGNIAVGDTFVAEVAYEVTGTPTKLQGLELKLAETGRGASNQSAFDFGYSGNAAAYMPGLAHKGVLRTPPITAGAGITGAIISLNTILDGSAGSAGVTVYWSDASIRKLAV